MYSLYNDKCIQLSRHLVSGEDLYHNVLSVSLQPLHGKSPQVPDVYKSIYV